MIINLLSKPVAQPSRPQGGVPVFAGDQAGKDVDRA